jgi:hypothetical protein
VKADSNHQSDHADWGCDEEYADDAGSRRFVFNGNKIVALDSHLNRPRVDALALQTPMASCPFQTFDGALGVKTKLSARARRHDG